MDFFDTFFFGVGEGVMGVVNRRFFVLFKG